MDHGHTVENTIALTDVLTHMGAGTVFALSGAWARQFCKHWYHQLLLGGLLVTVESVVVVWLVG